MDNFNKLQYSKFIGQDQIVVRSNDKTEFLDLIEFVDDFVTKMPKNDPVVPVGAKKQVQAVVTTPKTQPDTKICPIHTAKMYYHDGQYGPFWSHGNKQTGYCNGTDKGNKIDSTY